MRLRFLGLESKCKDFGFVLSTRFLVSSFCMFVLPFLIPCFKFFFHVCSIFSYSCFNI